MGNKPTVSQCLRDLAVQPGDQKKFKNCVYKDLEIKTASQGGLHGHGYVEYSDLEDVARKIIDELQSDTGRAKKWSFLKASNYCDILPSNEIAKRNALVQLMKIRKKNIETSAQKVDPDFNAGPMKDSGRPTDYALRKGKPEPIPKSKGPRQTPLTLAFSKAGPSNPGGALDVETNNGQNGVNREETSESIGWNIPPEEPRTPESIELPDLPELISPRHEERAVQKSTFGNQPVSASAKGKQPMRSSGQTRPATPETIPSKLIKVPIQSSLPTPTSAPTNARKRRSDRDATIGHEDTESDSEVSEPSPSNKRQRVHPTIIDIERSSRCSPSPSLQMFVTKTTNASGKNLQRDGQEQTRPQFVDIEEDETMVVSDHEVDASHHQYVATVKTIDNNIRSISPEAGIQLITDARLGMDVNQDTNVDDTGHHPSNEIDSPSPGVTANVGAGSHSAIQGLVRTPSATAWFTKALEYFRTCQREYLIEANKPGTPGYRADALHSKAALLSHVCSDLESWISAWKSQTRRMHASMDVDEVDDRGWKGSVISEYTRHSMV